MRKSGKLAGHAVNSNIAIGSLPTLQISLGIIALFLKRYMMDSRSSPSFQTSVRMYNTDVSIKWVMWKVWRSPTLCRYWETIIDFKWQKQGLLSSEKSLKRDQSSNTKFNPHLFSLVNTFNEPKMTGARAQRGQTPLVRDKASAACKLLYNRKTLD